MLLKASNHLTVKIHLHLSLQNIMILVIPNVQCASRICFICSLSTLFSKLYTKLSISALICTNALCKSWFLIFRTEWPLKFLQKAFQHMISEFFTVT